MSEDGKLCDIFSNIDDEDGVADAIEEVKSLLAAGEDPNLQNKLGYTPLILLASHWENLSEILKIIVNAGGDVNAKYSGSNSHQHGCTPLISACGGLGESGNFNHVQTLIDLGADIDITDNSKRTALHYAACYGLKKHADVLVKNSANLDLKDNFDTPLELAIDQGQLPVVLLLLKAGANVDKERCLNNANGSDYNTDEIKVLIGDPGIVQNYKIPEGWYRKYDD